MPYEYEYPRPSVSVDMVVFRTIENIRNILLIKRKHDPYKDHWALPGGFLNMDETLEEAADRELLEETGLTAISREQIGAYSRIDRDPRGRVITIAFRISVASDQQAKAASDASDSNWFPLEKLPQLAFDHAEIIADAV